MKARTVTLSLLLLAAAGTFAADLAGAVERGETKHVDKLLASGSDVNETQVDGMTALHWAAHHDDLATLTQLLKAGAKATVKNRYGITPLYSACLNGNGEMVEALLVAGANAKAKLPTQESVLMTASRTGNPRAVKALLAEGADANATLGNGQTALMWAAAEGNLGAVQRLIKAGARVDAKLKSGFTPLLFAVREGKADAVAALLASGAQINDAVRAARGGLPNGSTPLTIAVENGHFELAMQLIKAGANPNEIRTGYSPLHMMSWVRKPNGGDGANDLPPPDGSGTMTSLQFVRELVKSGADVNVRAKSGHSHRKAATPFFLAAWTADLPLMQTLLALGADPKIKSADKSTALMAATGIGRKMEDASAGTEDEILRVVPFLIELGIHPDVVNKTGETAMHGAAYKNLPKVVGLLDQHADVQVWNKRNSYGSTPYLIAAGYRPGNFKPSTETMVAIKQAMARHNLSPDQSPPKKKGWNQ